MFGDGYCISKFARKRDISNHSVYNSLKPLKEAGLIEVEKHDGREKIIHLTPRGRIVCELLLELKKYLR